MEQEQLLRNIVKWQKKTNLDATARLGDTIKQLMDKRVTPKQARFASVAELWIKMLPCELAGHCRIVDFSNGQLKVQADSKAYEQELRWCSEELLEQIKQNCPQSKVNRIKFVIG